MGLNRETINETKFNNVSRFNSEIEPNYQINREISF